MPLGSFYHTSFPFYVHDPWQTDFISKFPTRHLRWSFSTLHIHLHACHTCVCTACTWTRRPEDSECPVSSSWQRSTKSGFWILFKQSPVQSGILSSSAEKSKAQYRLNTLRQLLQYWHCSGGMVKSKTCFCGIHFQIRIPRTCSIVSWAMCSR